MPEAAKESFLRSEAVLEHSGEASTVWEQAIKYKVTSVVPTSQGQQVPNSYPQDLSRPTKFSLSWGRILRNDQKTATIAIRLWTNS